MATTQVYDTAAFATNVDITLPPKAPKAKKEAAPKPAKVVPAELENLELPQLQLGTYAGAGSCFKSRVTDFMDYSPEQEAIISEAWMNLERQGVGRNTSAIAALHAEKVAAPTEADPKATVSKYDLYNRTPGGKAILADLREKDQEIKRINDSMAKAFIKSSSSGTLYSRWIEVVNRNRKIISGECYYLLGNISKYCLASLIGALIMARRTEIIAEVAKGAKQPQAIEVSTNTVRSFLAHPEQFPSFPLSRYFFKELWHVVRFFPEPVRGSKEEEAEKSAAAALSSSSDDDVNLTIMIKEIISIVRSEAEEKAKARNETASTIRTTEAFKKLLNHLVLQFADKVFKGLHIYNREANRKPDGTTSGGKIDFEELSGRLQQLVYESTDGVFEKAMRSKELESLEGFLDRSSQDFANIEKYREQYNLIEYARKTSSKESKEKATDVKITTDDIVQRRALKQAALELKELTEEAAKANLTIDAYKQSLINKAGDRAAKKKAAEAKREAEAKEQAEKNKEAMKAKDKRWQELVAKHKEIVASFASVAPPPTQLIVGNSGASPVVSGSATPVVV